MNFLNPWMLLGGLGIALPILAHLLNKHQFKQTDWAAMQFLSRAINVRSRQIKLRDLLLLVLRPRGAGRGGRGGRRRRRRLGLPHRRHGLRLPAHPVGAAAAAAAANTARPPAASPPPPWL